MEKETDPPDAHSFSSLKYLTVQDMLWINLQVTKKVQHFNYARLEEATFYQYGYGASRDLVKQAGRFISGFMKLRPFSAGNEGTAFVGFGAFLLMNGKSLTLGDYEAGEWVERVRVGKVRPETDISAVLAEDETAHHTTFSDVRDAVVEIMRRFPDTLRNLSNSAQALAS